MKNYELELPQNYTQAKVVDAKDGKVATLFTILSLVIMAVTVAITVVILLTSGKTIEFAFGFDDPRFWHTFAFVGAMLVYVVLHELVHGVVYKVMTKQKLTFGLTLTVAFCGVPNVYTYRKTALCALLAPFVVFLPIFVALPFVLTEPVDVFWSSILLGMHLGGCVGDLYCTGLYLFKFRNPKTLMRDTGPTQYFYLPAEAEQIDK